jgi:hypothetical protein
VTHPAQRSPGWQRFVSLFVIPAKAGIQFCVYRFDVPVFVRPLSGRARLYYPLRAEGGRCTASGGWLAARTLRAVSPAEPARYFPFGESSQSHCARHNGFSNILLLKLPLVLADRRPRRTTRHIPVARPSLTLGVAYGVQIGSPCRFSRTSLCSNIRALLPLGAAMLGVMQRHGQSDASITAIHGLGHSEIRQPALYVTRAGSAQAGPLCCGEDRTIRPAGWAQGIAPTCRRAKDGASASPAGPSGLFVHGRTKRAAPGWPFSW